MKYHLSFLGVLLWAFIGQPVLGQTAEVPRSVLELIQRGDPHAKIEYCGAVSSGKIDYYLFLLERNELAGIVLAEQRAGTDPVIVDADTSLFPFRGESASSVEKPVQNGIALLLRRRNLAQKNRTAQHRPAAFDPEVSAIGTEIDRVLYPITGFQLGSNSTREILRILRTGPAIEVDPRTAPPGSILVSPTQCSLYGPIYLGHAGIVGADGSIYSADARYGGARTKNFSLKGWTRQFSVTNGSYAFVLRVQTGSNAQGLRAKGLTSDPMSEIN
jgi:hypothetical protein